MVDIRGFSILELVVALSLASILAGVGVLSHNALRPRLNLSMAVRQVVMDLQVSRMRAVAQNANHRIVFSNGSTSYRLQRQTGGAYDDYGRPVALPPGITVLDCTARDLTINFRPRGNASSFGTVTLANMAGDVRRVVVDIAGQVRVP
jgi:prepilin-type N-terminal cleavage/methylation domain-containing protein